MKKVIGLSSVALLGFLAACGDNNDDAVNDNNGAADNNGNTNEVNDVDNNDNNNDMNNDMDDDNDMNNDDNNNDMNDDDGETAEADPDYPEQPIEIIVPYSAGGGGDTVSRILSDAMSDELGEQVNVVNREGAGGEIGIAEMANAEPDGYTLGVFGYPDNFVLENTTDTDFTFDSFEYIASFDDVPHALFTSPGSGLETTEDVIEYAEENPGELTIGESGALGLLKVLAFEDEAGIDVSPVNYDGGGDLVNDLLGDHIDVASSSITAAPEITDSGGTPIGYAAAERLDMFDDYPTFEEQDLDLNMGVRRVVVAPEETPDEIIQALSNAMDQLGESEELEQAFSDAELPYEYLDYEELNDYLDEQNETLQPIIDENEDDF
ncbi:Bug family tripartite tricarboxylate transporter substrate binding protein [Alkalicoccus chagannorensis]|uniref:Bug family tripartite tricarboxylate transporter substrate binding protein n=1 Tax=Alkalicoccus chagannorensis TaxID=427072 RepID=UPI000407818C|nr:tripartite tricarboxylate transporter substrate binding protein [Alkalicoccus chagannorensis]